MNVLAAAQSALDAFSTAQAVTANNIANVNTEGFAPSRVDFEERLGYGGVGVSDIVTADAAADGASGTDLAVEMTSLIVNERSFEASAAVVATQDEMLGTFLDHVV
ncbi:flagellar basal-body rod protein FlgC [Desulfobaculum xiamenense]|uniref:Flagellar basal-body rod protein FlgC n=1 Tax=Desulfobaculum xiamenense TaxID=995050 RepID=A0A846QKM1_9BACT|nr:flagellar basal body protein [Desulfobaculum xiamenense]NJB67002.1 flagellar basal-body rod protein FlgC [Desulfobaculum xiamenense]